MKQIGSFKMLSPAPDVCQSCAVKHDPSQPHNQQSLHYQYDFYADNNRWPTWKDAMAHCSDEVKNSWIKALTEKGVVIE